MTSPLSPTSAAASVVDPRLPQSARQRLLAWTLNVPMAWVVLVSSLLVTHLVWQNARDALYRAQRTQFDNRVEQVTSAIRKRMLDYEQVLRGGQGLFAGSRSVERGEWKAYVESLRLQEHYPGIQGVGFVAHVPAARLQAHVDAVRAEGFPAYGIRPPGRRAVYTAIVYLEPFEGRNLRAFGYDMFSEPVRRAAMERARDTGQAAISGKVTLVQETSQDPQAGMLMYLPVYEIGRPHATPVQRRAHLAGYVYSPFRMNDLMSGILGRQQADVASDIDIEVFDGSEMSAVSVLYDDDRELHAVDPAHPALFTRTTTLDLHGHVWTLHFTTRPVFEAGFDAHKPLVILLTGAGLSLLLAGLVWLFATQRRRALALADAMSAEARSGATRMRAILDTVVDGIITINDRGLIESVNPAVETIFGYTAAELAGRNIRLLMPEPHRSRHDDYLEWFRATGERRVTGVGREVVGQRRDGSTFPLELSVSEMQLGGQRLFIGVMRDLTERKKVERLKNEFVSTVSHELRTPLTAITGSLGLLTRGVAGELPPQAQQFIDIAHKNCERLGRLINDILDIEKIEFGTMRFDLRPLALLPLVQQAVESIRTYGGQQGVEVALEATSDDARVMVDPDRFAQVMANLLSNAVKFSPPHGRVSVGVTRDDARVRVAVCDQGAGIPEEFRDRIFQRFAQADASDTRQRGGTGLGLSISKAIVERFGGRIGYESVPGRGAVFYVDLPVRPDAATDAAARPG